MVHQLKDHSATGIDLWEFISTNFFQHKVRIAFTSAYFLQPALILILLMHPKAPEGLSTGFRKLRVLCIWDSFTFSFEKIHCFILTIKITRYSTSIRSLTEFWCAKHIEAQEDKTHPLITATFAEALHTNTTFLQSFFTFPVYKHSFISA